MVRARPQRRCSGRTQTRRSCAAVPLRDVPVAQGPAVVFTVTTVVLSLGADLVAHRFAPRAGAAA